VKKTVEASNPTIKLNLQPITADESTYYNKLSDLLHSGNAPDIVYEDSFALSSHVAAGYLAPLDNYLAAWPDYKQQWFPSMQDITTWNGHNYGIMNGTDIRGIWYNKTIFQKAGLPTTWQPNSWADILAAARTIKAKVPGVTPLNLYAGNALGEAASMQGFEMLLYGTNDPLYDYTTNKWIVSSKGFQDSLDFVKQIYNPANPLGPSNDFALSGHAGSLVAKQLLPQGKLAIDIDGSWLPGTWAAGGAAPWPQWMQTMGVAAMPTQTGQAPKYVSLSGGWAYSISAQSKYKDQAFEVLKVAYNQQLLAAYDIASGKITPRQDVLNVSAYHDIPLAPFLTNLVSLSKFRPAFPVYPQVSTRIGTATQSVILGQPPASAMAAYAQAVTGIVGANNAEKRM
jgi:multiple sugar transport system substrate-binding protein